MKESVGAVANEAEEATWVGNGVEGIKVEVPVVRVRVVAAATVATVVALLRPFCARAVGFATGAGLPATTPFIFSAMSLRTPAERQLKTLADQ